MNYFEGYTKENARRRYMDLVKQFHPDRGGDGETMRLINAQYQEVQSSGSVYFTNPNNGYDPYSKRKLVATPAGKPASRPTDFWNSADFARAARNAAWDAGRQYARQQKQASAQSGSKREWWTTGEQAAFKSAARRMKRYGINSSWTDDKRVMEDLAKKRILDILSAAGYAGWMTEKILNVELTDVGNKWATFTIHTNYADFESRGLYNLAKIIRSSLKRFDETDTKFYRLKAEFGKLHGFQIKF